MNGLGATLRDSVGSFLQWWTGELAAMVPQAWLHPFAVSRHIVGVELSAGTLVFTDISSDTKEKIATIATDPSQAGGTSARNIAQVLSAHRPGRWTYGICLRDEQVLRKSLRLPAAVTENLQEVVALQLTRLTPFPVSDIYFDYRISGRSGQFVEIDLIVSRRDIVDEAASRMREYGIPVHFVSIVREAATSKAPLNLLPTQNRLRSNGRARLNVMLSLLALTLAVTSIGLPMERDRQKVKALEARLATVQREAAVNARLLELYDQTIAKLAFVEKEQRRIPSVTRILDDLTRLIPDDSWVSRLSYSGEAVTIVVHSPESGAIVRLIESSGEFEDARIVGAVRGDSESNEERFSLQFMARAETKPASAERRRE